MEISGEPIRVEALAQSGLSQVPTQYIQPPQNRPICKNPPTTTTSTSSSSDNHSFLDTHADVPVIDLFGFDPNHRDSVRETIERACREWGAFHVTNHGVPVSLLDDVRRVGVTFFNQCPIPDKLQYACDSNSAASEGYGTKMLLSSDQKQNAAAQVLDWRDYFDHHTLPLSRRNPSRWPHFPSDYREVVQKYSDEMKVLAQKLLGLISESLGLPSSCIESAVGDFYQNITISYYPPCPQPELTLGLQSHSDFGAITLLIQDDVGGLQVLKDDTKWVTVTPLSDAILVILADQTEIITNGKYRSTVHRAITNSNHPRLSVATFHDPAKTVKISPASELIHESSPPKYREVVYGDYVLSWYTKGPGGKRNIERLMLDS
ncbi:2-oxoglutarate (2OG) and Fe(II)-dependent oxygenase superfamily protein [Quillaja saponaria]|uniref:2-oxoglutarate (2OG) and Fe(II)-dependent oxygenase superfamily protein n=1 Tax=Quillaja saponaria TaxID=32244 RepID=A0AAD7LU64_QUISA|nr:2-oxoglutarate (2OG) and Fe(II)-dependent oxygenase superfamily protein [Quillaja saponaria]